MSPTRARARTVRSGVERPNHEVTAPPTRPIGYIFSTLRSTDEKGDGGAGREIKPICLLLFISFRPISPRRIMDQYESEVFLSN